MQKFISILYQASNHKVRELMLQESYQKPRAMLLKKHIFQFIKRFQKIKKIHSFHTCKTYKKNTKIINKQKKTKNPKKTKYSKIWFIKKFFFVFFSLFPLSFIFYPPLKKIGYVFFFCVYVCVWFCFLHPMFVCVCGWVGLILTQK